jgi:hypothetical protein
MYILTIVAVRTILIAVLEFIHVLAEALLALLARKNHLHCLLERVGLRFGVALRTVEPLLAAGRADGHLGVENVFAVIFC